MLWRAALGLEVLLECRLQAEEGPAKAGTPTIRRPFGRCYPPLNQADPSIDNLRCKGSRSADKFLVPRLEPSPDESAAVGGKRQSLTGKPEGHRRLRWCPGYDGQEYSSVCECQLLITHAGIRTA